MEIASDLRRVCTHPHLVEGPEIDEVVTERDIVSSEKERAKVCGKAEGQIHEWGQGKMDGEVFAATNIADGGKVASSEKHSDGKCLQDISPSEAVVARELTPVSACMSASGKLPMIQKLLTWLKAEGCQRVLVMSHFLVMLDFLEDVLFAAGIMYERIDAACTGTERREAIKR